MQTSYYSKLLAESHRDMTWIHNKSKSVLHTLSSSLRVVFDTGAAFDETLSIRPVGSEDESDEILIPNNFTNGDLQETNYVELHSGVYE